MQTWHFQLKDHEGPARFVFSVDSLTAEIGLLIDASVTVDVEALGGGNAIPVEKTAHNAFSVTEPGAVRTVELLPAGAAPWDAEVTITLVQGRMHTEIHGRCDAPRTKIVLED
jgi:hypothetical protein